MFCMDPRIKTATFDFQNSFSTAKHDAQVVSVVGVAYEKERFEQALKYQYTNEPNLVK